tara:strand:+ start:436 stop:642 length:207 start_codon:yes stop_codon:yes gene_type:complete
MEIKLNLSKYHIRLLYHSICELANNHKVNNCQSEHEQAQLHKDDIEEFNSIIDIKNKIALSIQSQGGL